MESHDPNRPDMFFDSTLYLALLEIVFNILEVDQIKGLTREMVFREGITDAERALEFRNVNVLGEFFENVPEVEQHPFDYLFLLNGFNMAGVIVSEPWAEVGGPDLYHDSYTQAIFTASDISQSVLTEAKAFGERTGAEISEICRLGDAPAPTILVRIKKAFGWRK